VDNSSHQRQKQRILTRLHPSQTLDFWRWDDPTFGEKWQNSSAQEIDLSSPALRALTAALGPGLIRIGGSPDDSIVFDADGTCVPGSGGNGPAPPLLLAGLQACMARLTMEKDAHHLLPATAVDYCVL